MRKTILAAAAGLALALVLVRGEPQDPGAAEPDADEFRESRMEMIREIEADVRATSRYTGKKRFDPRVMAALERVPRHEFVPRAERRHAYRNRPLPIGEGQTISQPYIVALMTELLDLEPDDRVLEVGTGSGYQAAVLAELVEEVYSIEIIPSLGRTAAERLAQLGYDNVEVRIGDGYRGWPEHAPFDAVIVTAAAPEIPPALLDQLAPGGRMVLPLVKGVAEEELTLIQKSPAGEITTRDILPVRFVPLTGDH